MSNWLLKRKEFTTWKRKWAIPTEESFYKVMELWKSTECLRGTTDLNHGIPGENMATGTDRRDKNWQQLTITNYPPNSLLFITKAFVQVYFSPCLHIKIMTIMVIFSSNSSYSRKYFWNTILIMPAPYPIQNPSSGITQAYRKKSNSLTNLLKPQLTRDSKALWICYHTADHVLSSNSEIPPACLFPPVQLFLYILNVLSKLFNLKLRDCLLLLIL